MSDLAAGLLGVHRAIVKGTDTAMALGSGSVPVLATPRLVAWLEAAAVGALSDVLPEGQTTVGTEIDLKHLAATAIGQEVTCRATVISVDGRTIEFELRASDDRATIASGRHARVIVDEKRFLAKL